MDTGRALTLNRSSTEAREEVRWTLGRVRQERWEHPTADLEGARRGFDALARMKGRHPVLLVRRGALPCERCP
ncbi:MAG: hypothetical protein HYZ53_07105 [Planctomycetes bacterium]|nr:hypothetical protein [Planctomycetota bacterium]